MSTLLELAERCEKALEADRELDIEILRAITGQHWLWLGRGGKEVVTWAKYGCGAVGNPVCSLEAYTASIDDAMTLVPATHHILAIEELPRSWIVKLGNRTNDRAPVNHAEGKTLATSICAAALDARTDNSGEPK